MEWDSFKRRWDDHIRVERHLSPLTCNAYLRVLDQFITHCKKSSPEALSAADINRWLETQSRQQLSPASIRRNLSALRAFFNWGVERQFLATNPCQGIRGPKRGKPLPKTLNTEALESLFNACDDTDIGIRDRAVFELFYSSGIRLSELSQCKLNDLHQQSCRLRVMGKGSKERIVPVGSHAISAIQNWLSIREQWLNDNSENALFLSQKGAPLSQRQIQMRLKQTAIKAGIPQSVHPHLLRHSAATHFLEGSQDLRSVQEFLGHSDIRSTELYTHLDFRYLSQVYDAYHPKARRQKD